MDPNNKNCPRCHEGLLRSWRELTDEEREVVKRLPGSSEYASGERIATHQWCTRCWYEESDAAEQTA